MEWSIKLSLLFAFITICGLIYLWWLAPKYKETHCLITQLSAILFDLNDIEIQVSDNLENKDFKIVNLNSGNTVFENNEYQSGIKNEYGFCLFNVYYKDSLIFEIGHDKFNNWHTNYYVFVFNETDNVIEPTLIINGPDRNHGELFYKRFDRDSSGLIYRIVYMNEDKKIYNEELIE